MKKTITIFSLFLLSNISIIAMEHTVNHPKPINPNNFMQAALTHGHSTDNAPAVIKKIKTLSLASRGLSDISFKPLLELKKLEKLDLSNNHITDLDFETLSQLNLKKITLSGNPIRITDIAILRRYMIASGTIVEFQTRNTRLTPWHTPIEPGSTW